MDAHLDQFMEDQINGGYGYMLDQMAAEECAQDIFNDEPLCPNCDDEGCEFCGPSHDGDTPLDGDHDSTMASIG